MIARIADPSSAATAAGAAVERLPYVDEHPVVVAAGIEDVWTALLGVVERGFELLLAGVGRRAARIGEG